MNEGPLKHFILIEMVLKFTIRIKFHEKFYLRIKYSQLLAQSKNQIIYSNK